MTHPIHTTLQSHLSLFELLSNRHVYELQIHRSGDVHTRTQPHTQLPPIHIPTTLFDQLAQHFTTPNHAIPCANMHWILSSTLPHIILATRTAPPLCDLPSLLTTHVLSHEHLHTLQYLLETNRSILFAGPPDSGKTLLLQASLQTFPPTTHITLVQHHTLLDLPNVTPLHTHIINSDDPTTQFAAHTLLRRAHIIAWDHLSSDSLHNIPHTESSTTFATLRAHSPQHALQTLLQLSSNRPHRFTHLVFCTPSPTQLASIFTIPSSLNPEQPLQPFHAPVSANPLERGPRMETAELTPIPLPQDVTLTPPPSHDHHDEPPTLRSQEVPNLPQTPPPLRPPTTTHVVHRPQPQRPARTTPNTRQIQRPNKDNPPSPAHNNPTRASAWAARQRVYSNRPQNRPNDQDPPSNPGHHEPS